MIQTPNPKLPRYDLKGRTLKFAQRIMMYTKSMPKTTQNFEIIKQLIRSGGSVGANYIEANEALGKKDFLMRIKICKKESKESRYWLTLTEPDIKNKPIINERDLLIKESTELMKIFGSIIEKSR
ncbi:MAG: four helix bundle protein [Candidatus Omnitrophota bacterium]